MLCQLGHGLGIRNFWKRPFFPLIDIRERFFKACIEHFFTPLHIFSCWQGLQVQVLNSVNSFNTNPTLQRHNLHLNNIPCDFTFAKYANLTHRPLLVVLDQTLPDKVRELRTPEEFVTEARRGVPGSKTPRVNCIRENAICSIFVVHK